MSILPTPAARRALAQGKTVVIEQGCDERNGSYPFERVVYVQERYGEFQAVNKYEGGLNRLGDTWVETFDTEAEAILRAQAWV